MLTCLVSDVALLLPAGKIWIKLWTAPVGVVSLRLADDWSDWHGRNRFARLKLGCGVVGLGRSVVGLGRSVVGLGRSVVSLGRSVVGLGRSGVGGLLDVGSVRVGVSVTSGSSRALRGSVGDGEGGINSASIPDVCDNGAVGISIILTLLPPDVCGAFADLRVLQRVDLVGNICLPTLIILPE